MTSHGPESGGLYTGQLAFRRALIRVSMKVSKLKVMNLTGALFSKNSSLEFAPLTIFWMIFNSQSSEGTGTGRAFKRAFPMRAAMTVFPIVFVGSVEFFSRNASIEFSG